MSMSSGALKRLGTCFTHTCLNPKTATIAAIWLPHATCDIVVRQLPDRQNIIEPSS